MCSASHQALALCSKQLLEEFVLSPRAATREFTAVQTQEQARELLEFEATPLFFAKNFLLLWSICAMLLKIFCAMMLVLASDSRRKKIFELLGTPSNTRFAGG
jgi:hypothetical protein